MKLRKQMTAMKEHQKKINLDLREKFTEFVFTVPHGVKCKKAGKLGEVFQDAGFSKKAKEGYIYLLFNKPISLLDLLREDK